MADKKKYGPPLKQFNILGTSEIRNSRLIVVVMFVSLALVSVIGFLVKQNGELQQANVKLNDERTMYGFPNSEGVFVSSREIPRRHIEGFVSWYLANYYNFTPESSEANANEALRIMSPKLRVKQEQGLRTLARQAAEQNITQAFASETPYTIEFKPGVGYIVSFKGMRLRATLNRVFNKARFDVKLLIKPVKPSAHFDWAVVVDDFNVQEI